MSNDIVQRLRRIGHPHTTEGRIAAEAAAYIEELERLVAVLGGDGSD